MRLDFRKVFKTEVFDDLKRKMPEPNRPGVFLLWEQDDMFLCGNEVDEQILITY